MADYRSIEQAILDLVATANATLVAVIETQAWCPR